MSASRNADAVAVGQSAGAHGDSLDTEPHTEYLSFSQLLAVAEWLCVADAGAIANSVAVAVAGRSAHPDLVAVGAPGAMHEHLTTATIVEPDGDSNAKYSGSGLAAC